MPSPRITKMLCYSEFLASALIIIPLYLQPNSPLHERNLQNNVQRTHDSIRSLCDCGKNKRDHSPPPLDFFECWLASASFSLSGLCLLKEMNSVSTTAEQ